MDVKQEKKQRKKKDSNAYMWQLKNRTEKPPSNQTTLK